jgi:hypothetical protein
VLGCGLILLANLQAGFHEQIRLQPEISEALDAPLRETAELKRRLLAVVLPDSGSVTAIASRIF